MKRLAGLQRASEVSPSMDRPPGTVYRLYFEHQSCHRTLSYVHWTRTCSRPPGTVETFYAIRAPNINTLTQLLTDLKALSYQRSNIADPPSWFLFPNTLCVN